MTNSLEDEVRRIVASMDDKQNSQAQDVPGTTERETGPEETIHIHYFPDAIVILKEDEKTAQSDTIETTLAQTKQPSVFIAYAVGIFYLFLILSCIAFQMYEVFNPPIATVTIIPKSQQVTLSGTLQLGIVLQPITISQSQTVATTGRGHQDAKNATGTVTFFNGLFTQQFIASGTVYTGSDGVEIVTTQDATIPAGSPNKGYGTLTVTAQALQAGSKGNIQAGDIAIAINNGLLVRNNQFHNGQDERNFQTVSKNDIDKAASPLKISVTQSISGAFQGQLRNEEQLQILPCSPTVTPNRNIGDEAIQVKVTVSLTCSGIAYNTKELENKATALLSSKAQSKLSGYSLLDGVKVYTVQATITHNLVFFSIKATGTWIYALSRQSQTQIKELLAGKTKAQALKLLETMPGIERGSISFTGFMDDTRLPKDSRHLHIILIVM